MTFKYLLAAAAIIGMAVPVSAQSVKAGVEAWQHADYAGAVAAWRPLAEAGDADAQFNLAQAYRLGRGVQTNLSAAKTWFERAARQGHVDAQTTLGLLLFQNGDQANGLTWLKQAAEKGEARALLVFGTALVNGDGVTQDPVRGYAYVSRAAAQGLAPAKETLAQLDTLIPLADRKRGVALARQLARATPAPAAKAKAKPAQAAAAAKSKAKPAETVLSAKPAPTPPAAKAAPLKAISGNWRVQLGAFSQRGSAEALYQKLSGKSALSGRRPFYIAAGAVTRLQAGPFESKSAADAACRSLGVPCFSVPAK
ncbi:MAG TPA: SPOR domain-containing protein [Sphingomicrobium sp.]|jgi:cell division septation protein DedD